MQCKINSYYVHYDICISENFITIQFFFSELFLDFLKMEGWYSYYLWSLQLTLAVICADKVDRPIFGDSNTPLNLCTSTAFS
jgi:hypothetical protein